MPHIRSLMLSPISPVLWPTLDPTNLVCCSFLSNHMITILYIILHAGENSSPPKSNSECTDPSDWGAQPSGWAQVWANGSYGHIGGIWSLHSKHRPAQPGGWAFCFFNVFLIPFSSCLFFSFCFYLLVSFSLSSYHFHLLLGPWGLGLKLKGGTVTINDMDG